MRLKQYHIYGIIISLLIIVTSLFLIKSKIFLLILGIGVLIGISPFVITVIQETRINSEKEKMFLEFSRNLVESVKVGTPIIKSIINIRKKPYGVLDSNIQKLANQIMMGIPLKNALENFSKDVNNKVISRALTLIGQAEKAGGDIGQILESVAGAVSMSDKLKKEKKATVHTLVIQGYIIFFVFVLIIIIMQYKILPIITEMGGVDVTGPNPLGISTGGGIDTETLSTSFIYLLLIQGLFSGLTIGKLSEGKIKYGIKHSFALISISFLIYAGAFFLLGE